MTPTFNLIDEPFIPCRSNSGTQLRGLRDTLAEAHRIAEIADPSPLTTFALYRLLLVIVHRCLDAGDRETARREGRMPMTKVDRYLNENRARFDLFDRERPFLQKQDVDPEVKLSPVTNMFAELPSGTNINHARHTYDAEAAICPCCCTHGLLRLSPFCPSGGAGAKDSSGKSLPGKARSINDDAPTYFLPVGENLLSTLLANVEAMKAVTEDRPAWEPGTDRPPEIGYREGLTWQPRDVLLFPLPPTAANCSVCGRGDAVLSSKMYFQNGRDVGDERKARWSDPNVAYRLTDLNRGKGGAKRKPRIVRGTLSTNEPKQEKLLVRGQWLLGSWRPVVRAILESVVGGEGQWNCRAIAHRVASPATSPASLTVLCFQSYIRPGQDKTTHQAIARWHIADASPPTCSSHREQLQWLEESQERWQAAREAAVKNRSKALELVPPELHEVVEFERRAEAHFRDLLGGVISAAVFRTRVQDDAVALSRPERRPGRVIADLRLTQQTEAAVRKFFLIPEVAS